MLLLIGLAAGMSLRADVVFSNVSGQVVGVNGFCGSAYNCVSSSIAEQFTPTANYSLTDAQVVVAAGLLPNSTATFDVFLYTNSAAAPASAIEEIGTGLTAPSSTSLVVADTISSPLALVAGTPYWLVLTPDQASSAVLWADGAAGQPVPWAYMSSGGNTWQTGGNWLKFQIDGTPVGAAPEPASFAFVASLAWLYALWRILGRASRAIQRD